MHFRKGLISLLCTFFFLYIIYFIMVVDVSIMDIYVSSKNVDGYFHCIIVGLGLSPVYQ